MALGFGLSVDASPGAAAAAALDLGDGSAFEDDTLSVALAAFTRVIEAAVASYVGVQVSLVQDGQPVTVTAMTSDETARTSLRLPQAVLELESDAESMVVLYASTPGAFVDLAADLCYSLHATSGQLHIAGRADQEGGSGIAVDVDVPGSALVSGVSGLKELCAVERAVGVLIDRGHYPDEARAALSVCAAREDISLHEYAARVLARLPA